MGSWYDGFVNLNDDVDDYYTENEFVTINNKFVPITAYELYGFDDLSEVAALCSFEMLKYLYDNGYVTEDDNIDALYIYAMLGINDAVIDFLEKHFEINVENDVKHVIPYVICELGLIAMLPECTELIQPHVDKLISIITSKCNEHDVAKMLAGNAMTQLST